MSSSPIVDADSVELPSVGVAYLHTGIIHHAFMESLINAIMYDMRHDGALRQLHAISDPYIPQGRCQAVEDFLKTDSEWLWFLDYDIIFEPEVLGKLLDAADPVDRPIVSALYLAHFYEAFRPCWLAHDGSVISTEDYVRTRGNPEHWPLPLAGCGMGCTLIHRSVLEKIAEKHRDDPWPWFGHDIVRKQDGSIERMGEDFTFCFRAKAVGASVWGVPVEVGHQKSIPISVDTPHLTSR